MLSTKIKIANRLEAGDTVKAGKEMRKIIEVSGDTYCYVTNDYITLYDYKGKTEAPRFTGNIEMLQGEIDKREAIIERNPDPTRQRVHDIEIDPLINKEGWWANPSVEAEINMHIEALRLNPLFPSIIMEVATEQFSCRGIFFD
jgi:hypothetical protein